MARPLVTIVALIGLCAGCGFLGDSAMASEQLDRCFEVIDAVAKDEQFDLGPDDEDLVERLMATCLEDPAQDALRMECGEREGEAVYCLFEDAEGSTPVIDLSEAVRDHLS